MNRILPTCTFVAAEAGLSGQDRRWLLPMFTDTCLVAGNGYVALEWRGQELAAVFPGNHVVLALPDDLPLPGIVERLAALLPAETAIQIDNRAGGARGSAVLSVGGTAYTLATGSMFNFYPWACNEPATLDDRMADIENAFRYARRKAAS